MSLLGEPDTAELASATTQRENDSGTTEVNMATVLQGLQTTMAQLAKNSELQTEAIQNLKEDILLCSGDEDTEDNPALDDDRRDNELDIAALSTMCSTPYTRLCKEDIAVSTKLFGDDLSKHLKDMSEAKKAGQQMQKPYSNSSHRGAVHSQKRNFSRFKPYHYDQTRGSGNKSTNRQSFLGQGRPSTPFRKKQSASNNNTNNKN